MPAIIEWPGGIEKPRVTAYPAATMDIFPTIAEIVGIPESEVLQPCDGTSLAALLEKEIGPRTKPIPFRHGIRAAWIDNDYKLLTENTSKGNFQLYNLAEDANETVDLSPKEPEIAQRMEKQFTAWNATVERSAAGKDYPEGRILPGEPESRFWMTDPAYAPYLDEWKKRPEYEKRLSGKKKAASKKEKSKPKTK